MVIVIQRVEEQTEDVALGDTGAEEDDGGGLGSHPDVLESTGEKVFGPQTEGSY